MRQVFFIPHPALSDFINNIMLVEAQAPDGTVCPFPPIPNNCLYFYINDPVHIQKNSIGAFEKKAAALLVGAQWSRVNIAMGHRHLMVCVSFQPGGMYRFLKCPMHELFEKDMDAELFFGSAMASLNQELKEANDFLSIKHTIESFLLKQLNSLKPLLPVDKALQELVKADGNMSVDTLASLSCVSHRQLERQCRERMGFSPKQYARLTRFSKAYRLKERKEKMSWSAVAHACGYFDQMHLIRDFKEFAGVSPGLIEAEWQATPYRLQAGIKV